MRSTDSSTRSRPRCRRASTGPGPGSPRRLAAFLTLGLAATACGGSTASDDDGLTVFAAASLRDLMQEIGALWEEDGAPPLTVSFAGSNVLARQLLARPAADVFLSADPLWVDRLEAAGRLRGGTRRRWLSNRLAVIAHRDAAWEGSQPLTSLSQLAELPFRHLAIADPRGVPAGRYARAWLEGTPAGGRTLWQAVSERSAPTSDVRAARGLVETDPLIVGIVYRTDALASDRVRIIWEAEPDRGPPVDYVVALLADRPHPGSAGRFLELLAGPRVADLARRHGFTPLPQSADD